MNRLIVRLVAAGWVAGGLMAAKAGAAETPELSKSQEVLSQASEQQEFTFILFYKEENAARQKMAQTLNNGLSKQKDRATVCSVSLGDASEKPVVERFGVGRAPMPLTLAVAPNGAVTGILSQKALETNLGACFVTPTMAHCMKSLQEGKLVLVCIDAANGAMPASVKEFQADPQFRDRLAVVSLKSSDSGEAQLFGQMQIDPAKGIGPAIALLAPPGVLVGKFDVAASKAEMAAALHKAGKCCDDPNCKHAQGPPGSQQATPSGRQAQQNPSAKRN